MAVAVLFARADSFYKSLDGVEVFDAERDARNFGGVCPVVAHPPCRAWGRLRKLAKPRPDEKDLARFAVDAVRLRGGILEHPQGSMLWQEEGLPRPREGVDAFGGFTLQVSQLWWGHKAEKSTWLYVVGADMREIEADIPFHMGYPSHVVTSSSGLNRRGGFWKLPELSKAAREHTPPELAKWLVKWAERCEGVA